ncbi:MAG: YihY/virulence factor BrkB family protein [Chloroflexia bacterium]
MNPKAIFGLFKDSFKEWNEDKAPRLGASLAYYTVFSLGPLLLIVTSIASIVFKDARRQITSTIGGVVGSGAEDVINTTIDNANKSGSNIIATVAGLVILLVGAAGVFGQLKDALNTIWEVQPKPGLGIAAMLKDRFLSFTMVLGTGFLLLVSLVISAGVAAFGAFLKSILPGSDMFAQILNYVITFLVIAAVFALLFKYLPDIKIGWSDVMIGSAVSALLFLVGQFGLALYLSSGSVGKSFGAASTFVVVLVWMYYSAQIFLFGAEFTQVYTNKYGSRVTPDENAEPVTEEAREQQGIPRKDDGGGADREDPGREKEAPKRRKLRASPWFR